MRVDDQKPSAAEQAARDGQKRQNVKAKDPALTSQSAQQTGRSQQSKEAKSAFDQILESLTMPTTPSQAEAAKFDAKVKDAMADQEKDRDKSDQKKDKKEDKKVSSSDEKEVGRSSRDGALRDKVIGKQDMGSGGGGGGSKGSDDRGGSSSGQSGQQQMKQAPLSRAEIAAAAALQGPQRTENVFSGKIAEQALQKIPQHVLDQIVSYVRVGLNEKLNREIQLDLSDKIFRGLSLKVSSENGKIHVSFLTGHPDVRRLFESQSGKIRQELEEKGVKVQSVRVQFLG